MTPLQVSYEITPRSRPGAARQTRPQPRFVPRNVARLFCRTPTGLWPAHLSLRRRQTPARAISNLPAGGRPAEDPQRSGAVGEKIEMHRRFEAAAATICSVNLKRFLKEKLKEKEDRPI